MNITFPRVKGKNMAALQGSLKRLNPVYLLLRMLTDIQIWLYTEAKLQCSVTAGLWFIKHEAQTLKASYIYIYIEREKNYIQSYIKAFNPLIVHAHLRPRLRLRLHAEKKLVSPSPHPPPQGSSIVITHKIGQNVVVTTAVLPQGHNLWEKNIDTVNHPWDES